MKKIYSGIILFVMVALCSCAGTPPSSIFPLSDPNTSSIDERLVGKWEVHAGEGKGTRIFIEKLDEKNICKILFQPLNESTKVTQIELRTLFFSTYINGENYLNLRVFTLSNPDGKLEHHEDNNYHIIKYEFDSRNKLILLAPDSHTLSSAITRGKLHVKDSKERNIQINNSSEHLRNFVKSNKNDLSFFEICKLKRVAQN